MKIRITTVLCSFDTKMHHVSRFAKTDHTYISPCLQISKKSPTRFAWKGFYVRVIMRILSILIFFSRSFPSRPHPTPTEKNRKTTSPTPPPLQSTTQAQISQALLHVIPRNWTVSNQSGSKLVAFSYSQAFPFLYFYFFFLFPGCPRPKNRLF